MFHTNDERKDVLSVIRYFHFVSSLRRKSHFSSRGGFGYLLFHGGGLVDIQKRNTRKVGLPHGMPAYEYLALSLHNE